MLSAIASLAAWFGFGSDMEWGPVQSTGEAVGVDPDLISWVMTTGNLVLGPH